MTNVILKPLDKHTFNKVCRVTSVGRYQPTASAIAKFDGMVDADGHLYRYDIQSDTYKRRTASNVTDEKKCYRICVDGEKFSLEVNTAAARALFIDEVRDFDIGALYPPQVQNEPDTKWGLILIDEDGSLDLILDDFATEDEALMEKQTYLYHNDGAEAYHFCIPKTTKIKVKSKKK